MKSFKYEIKKIFKNKKLILTLLLSLLIVTVFFASNYINRYKIGENITNEYNQWYEVLADENYRLTDAMEKKD